MLSGLLPSWGVTPGMALPLQSCLIVPFSSCSSLDASSRVGGSSGLRAGLEGLRSSLSPLLCASHPPHAPGASFWVNLCRPTHTGGDAFQLGRPGPEKQTLE